MSASIPLVDVLCVDNNTSALDHFRPVLKIHQGVLQLRQDPLPSSVEGLIADADRR